MKMSNLDVSPTGNKPLTNCVRWLRTTLSPTGPFWDVWDRNQKIAAAHAVGEAELLLERDIAPALFSVTVEPLAASNGTTYVVCIDRLIPVVGKRSWDQCNRLTPVNRNDVDEANAEARVWATLLGVPFVDCQPVEGRQPNTVPEYGTNVRYTAHLVRNTAGPASDAHQGGDHAATTL